MLSERQLITVAKTVGIFFKYLTQFSMSRKELLHNAYTEYQDNNYFYTTYDYWIRMNSWYIFVCIYISDKMKNCTHKKQTKIPKSRNDSKIQSKTRRTRGKIVTPKHKNIWPLTFPGLVFALVVFILWCQFLLIAPRCSLTFIWYRSIQALQVKVVVIN